MGIDTYQLKNDFMYINRKQTYVCQQKMDFISVKRKRDFMSIKRKETMRLYISKEKELVSINRKGASYISKEKGLHVYQHRRDFMYINIKGLCQST